MSHADIIAAVERHGGRIVASFKLDEDGQTIGARKTQNARAHCSECGEPGHIKSRCRGKGQPPKLTHQERRRMGQDWLRDAAAVAVDPLAESKAILQARAEQRRAARKR